MVCVEPVAERADKLDVGVANSNVRRGRNTEQRRQNVRHDRVVGTRDSTINTTCIYGP